MCVYQLIFVFSIDCDNNSLTNSEIQQLNNNDVILLLLTQWRRKRRGGGGRGAGAPLNF